MRAMSTCLHSLLTAALLACGSAHIAAAQTLLYEYEGAASQDQFGTSVERAGDIDADGFADILASSRFENATSSGSPYVRAYSGRTGALIHEISGHTDQESFGSALAGAGDANGDGHDDILIGIPDLFGPFPSDVGEAVLYSGADGSVLRVLRGTDPSDGFGRSVTGAGDLDGDGLPDVVVGATRFHGQINGVVRAFSGATGAQLWETPGPELEQFGTSLAAIGDLDGDGHSELIAGSPSGALGFGFGRVRILDGATGAILSTIEGLTPFAHFGSSLSPMGDLDADGVPDFGVGNFVSLGNNGHVRIYSGATNGLIFDLLSNGLREFGTSIDGGVDVTGDGIPDLLVSGTTPLTIEGVALLYSGADGTLDSTVTSPSGDGWFGTGVALLGDTTGDGFSEYAVGGPRENNIGLGSGSVYVYARTPENGGTLCLGEPNSTGKRGRLTASSSSGFTASINDLTLHATGLPPNIGGFFVVGQGAGIVQNPGGSLGNLCLAGPAIGRYSSMVVRANQFGALSFSPNTAAIPMSSMGSFFRLSAMPGDTFNFQLWYRDNVAGMPVSNFTSAITIEFR